MATNSTIAIQLPNGKIQGISNNWDGYLSHTGKILLEDYQDEEKIVEITSRNLMRCIDRPEWYGDNDNLITKKDEKPFFADNYGEFLEKYARNFNYLWKNGKWYWVTYSGKYGGELTEEAIRG